MAKDEIRLGDEAEAEAGLLYAVVAGTDIKVGFTSQAAVAMRIQPQRHPARPSEELRLALLAPCPGGLVQEQELHWKLRLKFGRLASAGAREWYSDSAELRGFLTSLGFVDASPHAEASIRSSLPEMSWSGPGRYGDLDAWHRCVGTGVEGMSFREATEDMFAAIHVRSQYTREERVRGVPPAMRLLLIEDSARRLAFPWDMDFVASVDSSFAAEAETAALSDFGEQYSLATAPADPRCVKCNEAVLGAGLLCANRACKKLRDSMNRAGARGGTTTQVIRRMRREADPVVAS